VLQREIDDHLARAARRVEGDLEELAGDELGELKAPRSFTARK
jgi:hypothetical protein